MADPLAFDWAKFATDFSIAAVGALAGAFAGAIGAQRIAERSKAREELLKEVRNTNAAATLAYSITEAFIGVKKDNLTPLLSHFAEGRASFIEFLQNRRPEDVFPLDRYMPTLQPVLTSIEYLRQIVFDRVTASSKVLAIIDLLWRSIAAYNDYCLQRNKLIEEFKANPPDPFVYFGLENGGFSDERHPSILGAMLTFTDNSIQASKRLAEELVSHANELKTTMRRRQRARIPTIQHGDYSSVSELMPDPAQFAAWEAMFRYVRPLGAGIWTAEFEEMALAQI
jgi:hypothetical protein